jgi:hypothetical protein
MSGQHLALGDGWTETHFERGQYGPGDRPGTDAEFESSDENDEAMTVTVVPARYERSDGHERLRSLVGDLGLERPTRASLSSDAERQTAFAALAEYERFTQEYREVVCIARDPGDALAAAVWLTRSAPDARTLHRVVRRHRGDSRSTAEPVVADDDALAALFREESDRCVFSGQPTTSHTVELPYRYYTALADPPRGLRGVPRIPSTVRGLVGAVSHVEWENSPLPGVDLDAPVERGAPGEYRLDPDVCDAVAGAGAENFVLRRL